jgi:hypothetical protein
MSKNKNTLYIIGVFIIVLIVLFLFSDFGRFNLSQKNNIQDILDNPSINLNKQLEITGLIYSVGNTFYIKDNEGYKLEIRECSKNRDLTLNEKQTIKGYIFTIESPTTPIFYCGVYNDTEYFQRINSIESRLKQAEENKQLADAQKEAEEKATITKAQADAQIEQERQNIEEDYKFKLASIPSGADKSLIDSYDWLPPLSNCEWATMKGWTLGGCTGCSACIYEKVVDNQYKVSVVIQYAENRNTYRGNTLSVSTI